MRCRCAIVSESATIHSERKKPGSISARRRYPHYVPLKTYLRRHLRIGRSRRQQEFAAAKFLITQNPTMGRSCCSARGSGSPTNHQVTPARTVASPAGRWDWFEVTCTVCRLYGQENQLHFDAERCAGSTLSALPGPLKSQYGRLSVVIPVESQTMRKQPHWPWNLNLLFHEAWIVRRLLSAQIPLSQLWRLLK